MKSAFRETLKSQLSMGTIAWEGGQVLLVPTFKPVEDWKPIAAIELHIKSAA